MKKWVQGNSDEVRPQRFRALSGTYSNSLEGIRKGFRSEPVVIGVVVCALSLGVQAQEEMAWQIAKMIVNDVIHQSNHDSPGKATKVQNLLPSRAAMCGTTSALP